LPTVSGILKSIHTSLEKNNQKMKKAIASTLKIYSP
jgi:hypothetical protein